MRPPISKENWEKALKATEDREIEEASVGSGERYLSAKEGHMLREMEQEEATKPQPPGRQIKDGSQPPATLGDGAASEIRGR